MASSLVELMSSDVEGGPTHQFLHFTIAGGKGTPKLSDGEHQAG